MFQVYNSIIYHLCIVLCVHHPKWSLPSLSSLLVLLAYHDLINLINKTSKSTYSLFLISRFDAISDLLNVLALYDNYVLYTKIIILNLEAKIFSYFISSFRNWDFESFTLRGINHWTQNHKTCHLLISQCS